MIQNKTIYGNRIEQARKLSGYTQNELAEKIGVNQSAIVFYEKDKNTPSEDILKAIADATGFLPSFFERPPIEDFPEGSLSYRAYRSVTAKEEDRAYLNAKLLFEHFSIMVKSFALPKLQFATIKEKPEKAATIIRTALGVSPDVPLKNLTYLLERNGTIVLQLPIFLQKIDAFSTWVTLQDEKRPIIVESFGKPGDRLRFSLAHELGHIVLHHPPRTSVLGMEKEANDFASALLMPNKIMFEEFTKPLTLVSLAQLKLKWHVSMAALLYKARDLKVVTERQYTYLVSQMSSRGWKEHEPSNLDVPIEQPQLFRKMMEGLYDSPEKYALHMGMRDNRGAEISLFA
jgi:Zn-dependent peptidase ImmA (M78 family)/DNA-binding XRE family transcriptional regulator